MLRKLAGELYFQDIYLWHWVKLENCIQCVLVLKTKRVFCHFPVFPIHGIKAFKFSCDSPCGNLWQMPEWKFLTITEDDQGKQQSGKVPLVVNTTIELPDFWEFWCILIELSWRAEQPKGQMGFAKQNERDKHPILSRQDYMRHDDQIFSWNFWKPSGPCSHACMWFVMCWVLNIIITHFYLSHSKNSKWTWQIRKLSCFLLACLVLMNTIAAILFSAHVKEISTRKWLWDVRLAQPGHTHAVQQTWLHWSRSL